MAFTTHGHHIAGTPTDNPPETVARCGGPRLCRTCGTQADIYKIGQEQKAQINLDVDNELYKALEKAGLKPQQAYLAMIHIRKAPLIITKKG